MSPQLTSWLALGICAGLLAVIGIDRAEKAVAEARAAAVDAGLDAGVDTVTFRTGDVYALDIPDAGLDVVHAHQVLQHLTDPVAALREMARVCRPGGMGPGQQ